MLRAIPMIVSEANFKDIYAFADQYSQLAKALYNAALFRIRQVFTGWDKGENRTQLEQYVFDELQCTQKAYKGFSYRRVLSYPALDKILRATMNPDFFAGLPMQTAQSIVRQAVTDFKAWLAALRAYKKDSSSFTGKPRMPRYCKVDRKTFKVSNQDAALYPSKDGNGCLLKLPKIENNRIPNYWKDQQIQVTIEKNQAGVLTYAGTLYDDLAYGGLYMLKRDSVTKSTPVSGSGASLEGIKFAIINNNDWDVENTQTGISVPKGGVVTVITTDANGYAATGNYSLPVGKYIVRELRMDASFDGQQFSEGKSDYANNDYWWKEQSVTVSVTEQTAGTLVLTDPFYNSPVVTPVPTGIIITAWPYMAGMGGCILVFIVLFIWRHRKKRR